MKPDKIPTESFVIGTSRIGSAKIGDGKIIPRLLKGNNKNMADAIIGETAIKNGFTLISNDAKFRKRMQENGGRAISVDDLLRL